MNAQEDRRHLVRLLRQEVDFDLVIETGVYWGWTTQFLAETFDNTRFLGIERLPIFADYVNTRLSDYSNIEVIVGDSGTVMRRLVANQDRSVDLLAYLDAHWGERLPLWDELRSLSELDGRFIAIVDDCKVPVDDHYGYDDYGPGKRIDVATIGEFAPPGAELWQPRLWAKLSTGSRRGWCVVASPEYSSLLDRSGTLQRVYVRH